MLLLPVQVGILLRIKTREVTFVY